MRTPWLLVSILLHGAAVSVALVVGVYAHQQAARPIARIEIRNQPPSVLARTNVQPCPDVEAEDATTPARSSTSTCRSPSRASRSR